MEREGEAWKPATLVAMADGEEKAGRGVAKARRKAVERSAEVAIVSAVELCIDW